MRRIAVGLTAALLVVAGIAGWYAFHTQRPGTGTAADPPAGADANGVRVGTGPVTVDVYLDFMCEHCRDFAERADDTLAGLVSQRRATVVYHPLALLDSASSTDYSSRSAAASACAADAGRFVEYATALYAQQPATGSAGLTETQLVNLGSVAGITDGGFAPCVRSEGHRAWVHRVTERAAKAGVRTTPTVLVNGRRVAPDPQAIAEAVAAATP
jgi:protein-disulfide isomerase